MDKFKQQTNRQNCSLYATDQTLNTSQELTVINLTRTSSVRMKFVCVQTQDKHESCDL